MSVRCLDREICHEGNLCQVYFRGELVDEYEASSIGEAVRIFMDRTDLTGLYSKEELRGYK